MAEEIFQKKMYEPGQVIFHEGATGTNMYLIESGEVEISKNIKGQQKPLGKITKGGIFGEMALIDDSPRMATAKAINNVVCVKIPRARVDEALSQSPPFIRGLVKILVGHARK